MNDRWRNILFASYSIYVSCTRVALSFVHQYSRCVRSFSIMADATGEPTSSSSESREKGMCNTSAKNAPVIDLQLHTQRKSPAEFLSFLSKECERLDVETFDLYGDFHMDATESYLRRFESEIANHFGKEDGVFCLSGGMAQSIVLAINAQNQSNIFASDNGAKVSTKAFACHTTSHLLLHENDHFHELLGMQAIVLDHNSEEYHYNPSIVKEKGCCGMDPIRLSHVKAMIESLDGSSPSATRISTYPNHSIAISSIDLSTLILELPHREIGGKLTPWNEVEEIARLCKTRGIRFHCDGARIFEATAGYR